LRKGWAVDKVGCHNGLVEILGTAVSGAVAVGAPEVEDAATGGERVVLNADFGPCRE